MISPYTVRDENGVLVEEWDAVARIYTDHRVDPPVVMTYAEKSVADGLPATFYDDYADDEANEADTDTKLTTVDFPAMQAIIGQTNEALRLDPSQEIKDLARAVRRLTRKVERLLDGSD